MAYYRRQEFRPILERAVAGIADELSMRGIPYEGHDVLWERAARENKESADHRVVPIEERLARICGLDLPLDTELGDALSNRFLDPIFELGYLYEDSLPVLRQLKSAGFSIGIVSNAPWGSPPRAWRRELTSLGLSDAVDASVFCGDVGFRKPARQIFEHAAAKLGTPCQQCVFVGDDPEWDIAGSSNVGMHAILIDRYGTNRAYDGIRVQDLYGLLAAA